MSGWAQGALLSTRAMLPDIVRRERIVSNAQGRNDNIMTQRNPIVVLLLQCVAERQLANYNSFGQTTLKVVAATLNQSCGWHSNPDRSNAFVAVAHTCNTTLLSLASNHKRHHRERSTY